MFRSMARFKQQVSDETCREILKEQKRAVLSFVGDEGYPYTIPMNYYYDEEDNQIYLHCAKKGHKIDAIRACDKVCFTTWNKGYQTEGDWAWNVTSVVIFGRAHLDMEKDFMVEKLRKFGNKYFPTPEETEHEIELDINNVQMIAIEIEHMTGKLVNER